MENSDEEQIRTASWLFPLYLCLMNLFVLPIAMAGLNYLPSGSDPDLFVLTLPMTEGQSALGLLAFLGGFSSATSMVIVSSIALSTMLSNHIVMPVAMRMSVVPSGGEGARNDNHPAHHRRDGHVGEHAAARRAKDVVTALEHRQVFEENSGLRRNRRAAFARCQTSRSMAV